MPHLRRLLPVVVLACVLAVLTAGCGTAAPAAPAAPPTPPPGAIALTGDLRTPGTLDASRLAALPRHTVSVEFGSSRGTERHTETGALLADVLPASALAGGPGKNPTLSYAVLAVGDDGYTALVSYGEVSPDLGNRGILVATAQDGTALDRPRLVVPGDRKGGRYVSGLVELKVVRVAR